MPTALHQRLYGAVPTTPVAPVDSDGAARRTDPPPTSPVGELAHALHRTLVDRLDLAALETAWREAEEIAAIADTLLIPEGIQRRLQQWRGRG